MKSFDLLAQSAYAVFVKRSRAEMALMAHSAPPAPAWADLAPEVQVCWLAVAQHLVAEVAALH